MCWCNICRWLESAVGPAFAGLSCHGDYCPFVFVVIIVVAAVVLQSANLLLGLLFLDGTSPLLAIFYQANPHFWGNRSTPLSRTSASPSLLPLSEPLHVRQLLQGPILWPYRQHQGQKLMWRPRQMTWTNTNHDKGEARRRGNGQQKNGRQRQPRTDNHGVWWQRWAATLTSANNDGRHRQQQRRRQTTTTTLENSDNGK